MYFPEKVTHAFYGGEGDEEVNLVNNWQVEINCCAMFVGLQLFCSLRGKGIRSNKYYIKYISPFI